MYIGGNDKLYFALWDDSTDGYTYSYTNAALTSTQGSWTHVLATYDGSGANTGQVIYINGSSVAVTRASGTIGSGAYVAMENTDYPLKIGSLLDGNFFTGNSELVTDAFLYFILEPLLDLCFPFLDFLI